MSTATDAPRRPDSPTADRIEIPVTGMTCAACQGRVQRTLNRTPGVHEATVNLMTNSATVSFDPSVVAASALVERIRTTGYGAELPTPGATAARAQEAQDEARHDEYAELRVKAMVAGMAGAVSMIASMPLMAASAHAGMGTSADPFMQWTMRVLDPTLQRLMPWLYAIPPAALSYGLLLMALGIMGWAGRHFYTRAWIGFRAILLKGVTIGENSVVAPVQNVPLKDALSDRIRGPLDLFPWLMLAFLGLLTVESIMANRFYKPEPLAA